MDFEALKDSLVRREAVVVTRDPPTALPADRLEEMAAAADEVEECTRVLAKASLNVVGEVLREQGTFYQWKHYPKGDIYDKESHSQYYYHAHPSNLRGGEHGHFHTFVRVKGMPKDIKPAPLPATVERPSGKVAIAHLIGISMDKKGVPLRLFTVNRWVTGETWYKGEDVLRLLGLFEIDHAAPSWPTNRWVTAMIKLFRPQIEWLVRERDDAVRVWQAGNPDSIVSEDHDLEVTSAIDISVEKQAQRVRHALGR